MGIREELKDLLPEEAREYLVKRAKGARWFNFIKGIAMLLLTAFEIYIFTIVSTWWEKGLSVVIGVLLLVNSMVSLITILKLNEIIRKPSQEFIDEIKEFQREFLDQ